MSELPTTWTRSRLALVASATVIVFGLASLIVWKNYQQREAVREIERLGGHTWTEPIGPTWLSEWDIRIERVYSVDLSQTQITDQELQVLVHQHLSRFPHLKILSLMDTSIGDEGVAYLGRLTRLRGLHMSRSQVSDQGLQHLHGLLVLEGLSLEGTRVTEQGVRSISRALPNCRIYCTWQRPQDESISNAR